MDTFQDGFIKNFLKNLKIPIASKLIKGFGLSLILVSFLSQASISYTNSTFNIQYLELVCNFGLLLEILLRYISNVYEFSTLFVNKFDVFLAFANIFYSIVYFISQPFALYLSIFSALRIYRFFWLIPSFRQTFVFTSLILSPQ